MLVDDDSNGYKPFVPEAGMTKTMKNLLRIFVNRH